MKEVKRHQGQQFRRLEDEEGKIHVECKICKEIKPESLRYFYKQNAAKTGLRSTCKTCCDNYHMNRYKNEEGFKERQNGYARIWNEDNIDHVRKKSRERYKKRVEDSPELVREENRRNQQQWKEKQPAGIYKITCLDNGRVYIGESKCLRARWISHKSALNCEKGKTNKLLQEDWDRLGEKYFAFEIIEETKKDKSLLWDRELFYIRQLSEKGYELYNSERLEDE